MNEMPLKIHTLMFQSDLNTKRIAGVWLMRFRINTLLYGHTDYVQNSFCTLTFISMVTEGKFRTSRGRFKVCGI